MQSSNVQTILGQFNNTIRQWIGFLDDYSLEQLSIQPQPASWSLGQVYIHLLNETGYYIEQMKVATATNANSEKQMHRDGLAMFQNNSFPDMQLEGPATNTYIPQPDDKEVLRQQLLSLQNEVNNIFAVTTTTISTGKTEHPGLGFFTSLQWLQFAEMHMRHHLRQKNNIDKQLHFL
ncbi:MAG: DinB family protein [Chitinophagaceae bacterium]